MRIHKAWDLFQGGYLFLGNENKLFLYRFFQCFKKWGHSLNGTQKEFFFRCELSGVGDRILSLAHIELFNRDQGRIFFILLRVSDKLTLRIVLNLGSRLTKESVLVLSERAKREAMLRKTYELNQRMARARAVRNNNQHSMRNFVRSK